MKRNLLFSLLALVLFCTTATAQNNLGKTDDIGRVTLTPFIAENSNVPTTVANLMTSKMRAAITRSGLGSSAYDRRFVLTLNTDIVSREVTPTAPPMIATTLSPTFYIGDLSDGTLFATLTLPPVKGVGQTEDKAYMQALKNLNLNTADFARFIDEGKAKIIAYYNSHIDLLLKEAEAMCGQGDYDGSMALLMSVPTVCADAYAQAMKKVETVYQRKIDRASAEALSQAQGAWSASPDAAGAAEAGEWLAKVDPASSSAGAAAKLHAEMKSRVKELADREWAEEVQQQRNREALYQSAIEAAKEVAVAQASRPIYYTSKIYWW